MEVAHCLCGRSADPLSWPDVNGGSEAVASDTNWATNSPRRFGQLLTLSVPNTFDDPLPDVEIAAGEGDSSS